MKIHESDILVDFLKEIVELDEDNDQYGEILEAVMSNTKPYAVYFVKHQDDDAEYLIRAGVTMASMAAAIGGSICTAEYEDIIAYVVTADLRASIDQLRKKIPSKFVKQAQ